MTTHDVELHGGSLADLERRHAEEVDRLRLLVEASATLLGSLRLEEVLPRVMALAKRTLAADAYAVWRRNRVSGRWSVARYDGLSAEYVELATAAVVSNTADVSLAEPVVAEDIAGTEWLTQEHRAAHAQEGNRAFLAIALRHGEETLGTLTFYYREPHEFTESELSAAAALANLASAAITTTELYENQRQAAEERRIMAEASHVLASSLDVETTLANVANLIVPTFADWCTIDLADEEVGLRRLAVAHVDPAKVRLAEDLGREYPPDPDSQYGPARVIETGESELVPEVTDELLVEATQRTPRLLEIIRELGLTSSMCVPMTTRERVVGAITFVAAESGRRYNASDLATAEDLARRGAVAIENAMLLRRSYDARHEAEAAQERLAVLAEASQELASTLDYETTLANIARLLVPRYADWYAVDIIDDDGTFRRIAVVHRDPAKHEWAEKSRTLYGGDPNEPEGPGRVVRTGEAALYRTVPDELLASSTQNTEHYEILKQLGMESAMVVPLIAGGRAFGSLMLVSSDPERLFDNDDLEFAMHLGRRTAVAVDNARLYRAAQERARAALVVEQVADGVMLVDRDGFVRLWNPAAERITGLPASQAVGMRADDVFPTWETSALEQGTMLAQTQPTEVNGRELWLSFTGVAFADGRVYAFRDLTEERAVERLKSDFVATVSHELRTPLAAIYGAALTLQRNDVRLTEPQRSGLLEVVATEADRLARIVNDILWASRLESGTMQTQIESCDPIELARSVVDAAVQYVPPNIRLSLSTPDGAPPIAADRDKVRQVLTNLVDNAVKYSPDGGNVDVTVDALEDRMRFCVQDEGLGIPPTERERIFEKFYRLDPNLTRGVGGTGLGLYISRELVQRMDGRIWVEPAGERGSVFRLELPLAR
jgi:PAS domain S-box-containing protein